MKEDSMETRFSKTMLEIANQIKQNSSIINFNSLLKCINVILKIHKKKHTVFIYGAGRSGFIGRSFAQRLMHLGIKSCFISDAVTYQYTKEDLLVLISGSGETTSSVAIAKKAREIGGKLILISTNPKSTIGRISDVSLIVKGKSKDLALSQETLAPYTSLFDISTLAVLDSISRLIMNELNVTEADIDKRHASIE